MDTDDLVTGDLSQTTNASEPSTSTDGSLGTGTQGTGTESTASQTSATEPTPQVDWEARFKGLQPTVQTYAEQLQQERAARQAYEAQLAQYELALFAQQAQQQAQANNLPPEFAQQQVQAFQVQQQAQQQQRMLQQQQVMFRQQQVATQQQLEEAYRPIAAHQIAEQYHVPMKDILALDTPQLMIERAKYLALQRDVNKQQQRQSTGADRFEGQGLGASPANLPADIDQAAANFKRLALQLGLT